MVYTQTHAKIINSDPPGAHKDGHNTTYPSTYNTEIRQKRDARDHL